MQQNACLPEEIHKSDDTTGFVRRFYSSWKSYDKYTGFYSPETVVRNRSSATTFGQFRSQTERKKLLRRSEKNYANPTKNRRRRPFAFARRTGKLANPRRNVIYVACVTHSKIDPKAHCENNATHNDLLALNYSSLCNYSNDYI